ncbi:hypothetical protein BCR34DRAFT_567366 [Clohesyomyces aquaticus]|uniref:Uncharacterized protein n=1 Tax=Clohesyomyces aquaticus TaxID=1231657 RepID=A0A1Y1ZJX9_9PLEO|nr:hypothetical protein BCR34DRAFT_567366 [Clohesyomyces aquaticus]
MMLANMTCKHYKGERIRIRRMFSMIPQFSNTPPRSPRSWVTLQGMVSLDLLRLSIRGRANFSSDCITTR